MVNEKGFIANALLIAVVFGLIFASQQAFFKPFLHTASEATKPYWEPVKTWVATHIYPITKMEVEKRGEIAKTQIEEQKQEAAQSIWESIKNYFTGNFLKIFQMSGK